MKKIIFTLIVFFHSQAQAVDITITVSTTVAVRMNDAYSSFYKYQPIINGQPNPETKAQFSLRMIKKEIKDRVIAIESQLSAENAFSSQYQQSQRDIQIP